MPEQIDQLMQSLSDAQEDEQQPVLGIENFLMADEEQQQSFDPQDEGWSGWLMRQAVRSVPTMVESTVGLPSDVAELAGTAKKKGIERILGTELPDPNMPEASKEFRELDPQVQKMYLQHAGLSPYVENRGQHEMPFTSSWIHENVTEPMADRIGLSQDYLEPQSGPERILDTVVRQLPFLGWGLAKGSLDVAGFLHGLTRSAVSGSAVEGAQEMGLGPWGQFLAGFGSALGYDGVRALSKMTPKNLHNYLRNTMKNRYDKAKELGANLKHRDPQLQQELHEIEAELQPRRGKPRITGLKPKQEEQIIDTLSKSMDQIGKDGTISGNELIEAKQGVNQLARQASGVESSYYKRIGNALKNSALRLGENNPNFGINVSRADSAYQVLQNVSDAGSDLWDIAKEIGMFGTVKTLFGSKAAIPYSIYRIFKTNPEKYIPKDILRKHPDVKDYIYNAFQSAMIGDRERAVQQLMNFDSIMRDDKDQKILSLDSFDVVS